MVSLDPCSSFMSFTAYCFATLFRLSDDADRIQWPAGADDYILFYIGHKAAEVRLGLA